MQEKLEALKQVSLFSTLSKKHLDLIARVADHVEVAPGTELTREGRPQPHMAVIITGGASVTVGGEVLATLGAGDVVGELSLVDDQPASATVTTTEPTSIWNIAKAGFTPVWEKNPELSTAMLQAVVARLRKTNQLQGKRSANER